MFFTATPFQIKAIDGTGVIEGLGAFFGNEDLGGDLIRRGAFAKTLADRAGAPVPMLFCHDTQRPIGAWSDVKETADGLAVKGRFTIETRDGAEAYALAKDGALPGLSIGYKVTKESYQGTVRVLEEVKLFEVSPVPVPMNERAVVTGVKSTASPADFEHIFRDRYGLSGRKAKSAASAAWRAINDQTEDAEAEAELAAILFASIDRLAKGGR